MLICDFCSSPEVKWRLLTTTDSIKDKIAGVTLEQISVGDWAACNTCMALIVVKDKKALADRSFATAGIGDVPRWMRDELYKGMERVHGLFWKNYTGMYEPHSGVEGQ